MTAFKVNIVILLLGILVLWTSTDGLQALTSEGARRLEVAKQKPEMPNIILETMSGAYTHLQKRNGQITVVEFMYTTCPFICQVGGDDLARLVTLIKQNKLTDKVRVISISFDPLRDTINELAYFGKRHNADGTIWTVARPNVKDLPNLLKAFGVLVIPDKEGGYVHNSALHIMDHQGRLTAILDSYEVKGAIKTIKQMLEKERML